MGETEGTKQGTPPEPGQSPRGDAGSTSGGEPKTFTEEQVAKEVSDKLAAAGRDAKALDLRGKDLEAREEAVKAERERQAQWQKERDAEAEEAARDDPEELKRLRRERKVREREEALAKRETEQTKRELEHRGEIEAARETQREIDVWEVAKETGLDARQLKDKVGEFCTEFNVEFNSLTRGQITKVAQAVSAGKAPEPPKTPTPDSGRTTGGGTDFSKMSADDKLKAGFNKLNKK
jgi:hypothetical protein